MTDVYAASVSLIAYGVGFCSVSVTAYEVVLYSIGFVRVTVVGAGPQFSHTVTVVYHPEGTPVVAVASGQTVVVSVTTTVVNPVGHMSTYEAKERLVNGCK